MEGMALNCLEGGIIKRSREVLPLAVAVAAKPDHLDPVKRHACDHVALDPAAATPALWQVKADIDFAMIGHGVAGRCGAKGNDGAQPDTPCDRF